MNLTILGCYAATPRTFTNPTSQVLEISNRLFLIDCGEGTQTQLRKNKIRFTAINQIFISHLHGDHFYGLIGLISTFTLLNRHNSLTIYGPVGIKEVIKLQLRLANSWPQYELNFVELKSKQSEIIYEDKKVIVRTIPLKHRVYTNGFLFTEKTKERKLNVDKIQEYGIETCYFQNIKNGHDIVLDNGTVVPNHVLSLDPPKSKSYAFCSDTQYDESIVPIIKGVQVLYHESTFLNTEEHIAEKTMHSTAQQAAQIAQQANAEKLILGHYSTRYESIKPFKKEAETVFKNVLLGDDGVNFKF
ncbi:MULTISPECIES: ribonuclease Z [Flavobacterium]|uniref:Ribonuclease Z n=2 Tax=Flavobacterium TaxID=237 RepID=A0A2N9PBI9_9FLAO|nr:MULTISPECIES: ribonuclease Z [Flavobacterium]QYS88690.1 ribonuclease Z [Flavobacterium davisii]RVU92178.1 ribonuclease Z [Flavobacterium columnare]SPE77683.1 Ribonuclease BN [Flavobacterium columnare]